MVRRIKERHAVEPVGTDPLDDFDYPKTTNPLERPEDDFEYAPVAPPDPKKSNKLADFALGAGKQILGVEEPQSSLVPIGHGFYATPDEPVSPFNCEVYTSSPYCGGVGGSSDLASLDPSLVYGGDPKREDPTLVCSLGVNLTGSIGFVGIPNFQVVWKNPDPRCKPPDPPLPPPDYDGENTFKASGFGRKINPDTIVYAFVGQEFSWINKNPYNLCAGGFAYSTYSRTVKITDVRCPGDLIFDDGVYKTAEVSWSVAFSESSSSGKNLAPGGGCFYEIGTDSRSESSSNNHYIDERGDYIELHVSKDGFLVYTINQFNVRTNYPLTAHLTPKWTLRSSSNTAYGTCVRGSWAGIQAYFSNPSPTGGSDPLRTERNFRICEEVLSTNCKRYPPDDGGGYLPPSPNKLMDCCSELKEMFQLLLKNTGEYPTQMEVWDSDETKPGIQKTQREIVSAREGIRLVVELSNRLSRIIGIDLLPFTLPKTTVEKDNDSVLGDIWDFITPDETETITSIMDFFKWTALNDSANWGSWQRVIKEQGDIPRNSDGTPELDDDGNQKPAPEQKIVLPDMASTMEEQIRLGIRTQKLLGLIFDFIIKIQTEAAGIKTTAAQSLLRIEDIQEYLDYPTQEKSAKVPIQITIPNPNASEEERNDLHEFEKPSKAIVRYDDWTGENSLQTQLIQILQQIRYARGQSTGQ